MKFITTLLSFTFLIVQTLAQPRTLNLFARVLDSTHELAEKLQNATIYFDSSEPGSKLLQILPNDATLDKRETIESEFSFDEEHVRDIFKIISDNDRLELNNQDDVLQMTTSFVQPLIAYLIDIKSSLLDKLLQFLGIGGLSAVENVRNELKPSYNILTNQLKAIGQKSIPIEIIARDHHNPSFEFKIR
ncbi:hypothetical protein KGF54_001570 [Candida jiufengensis]|uniref:uncharacterized protein n=1 Tax=Candida jiufengensis TaxID=497108 RepID=UPI0022247641|nr:uncharacterized protein KGF54_001570 [Candida jiufengensis]KAI5955009.1 hypothetical protein KGF54_001570 [Candida jiufengensis]